VAIALLGGLGTAHAQTGAPQSLVYAVYDSPSGASDAFKALRETQREGVINIDAFAVISKDDRGRVRVHSTQRRGARAGAIVGALIGAVGGPAGALAGAGAGGGIGYLTGRSVGIPRADINAIRASLEPGSSALIAVIDERWVTDLERSLHAARAKQVLDRRIMGTPVPAPEENQPATPEDRAPPANP
jgi:uncharacterized membrane protein